jgi:hypothetical protein
VDKQKQIAASRTMSRSRILFITCLILIAVAAALALREYLLLKRIQETLTMPPVGETRDAAAPSLLPPPAANTKMVYAVKRAGNHIEARARFGVFKKAIESHPEILRAWGSLGWKILEDIPALCIRNLGETTPFSPLGVTSGECITHIDGETVNQPMRNLGIWLTLGSRSSIRIETLRGGRKLSYHLVKG